jgi:hypothetical protein
MDTAQILDGLRAQRERIDLAIASLEALNGTGVSHQTEKKTAKTAAHAVKSAKCFTYYSHCQEARHKR